VGHSLSPALHRAAYAALGLHSWHYQAIEVDEAGLAGWLAGLDAEWAGLSLTMPLKRSILPHLAAVTPLAAAVGAVNTVLVRAGEPPGGGDGGGAATIRLEGDNTDVHGILAALREGGAGPVGRAHVLGAGATACSAVAALRELGCTEPVVHARSAARAGELLAAADRLGVRVRLAGLDDLSGLGAADVVISTLPAEAADPLVGPILALPPAGVLLDVVYHPWPTRLGRAWQDAGGGVVGGLVLLLHQAVAQVALMTGRTPPVDAMRAAGEAALAGRTGGSGSRDG